MAACLLQQRAQAGDLRSQLFLDPPEILAQRLDVAAMLAPRQLELDVHVDQFLHDAVVQLPRQARPLLRRRAPAQRVQVAHPGRSRVVFAGPANGGRLALTVDDGTAPDVVAGYVAFA